MLSSGISQADLDQYVGSFLTGIYRGTFQNISNPDDAVLRGQAFAAGAAAFYTKNLEEQGIRFGEWQDALVDITNGVTSQLYERVMQDIANGDL